MSSTATTAWTAGCSANRSTRGSVSAGWSKAEDVGSGGDYCLYLSYDYLALLADARGYEAAKKYVDRLVKSMTDFTRDPAALSAVRDEIANQIEAVRQRPGDDHR